MGEGEEQFTSSQKAAKTAETGLNSLGGMLGDAANEKIEEYARRIVGGEDPRTMSVPGPWRAEVEAKINTLRGQTVTPVGSPVGIDFGTADEGTPRSQIEGHKIPVPVTSEAPKQYDPFILPPETKPDNSLLGRVRAQIEHIKLSRKLNSK
jgi:hypothetical protein